MSYVICRISKYKRQGCAKAQAHNWRQKECRTNKDIDWSRTQYNVYKKYHDTLLQGIDARLSEIPKPKRKRRKDAVYMTEILVTASPDFFGNIVQDKSFYKTMQADYLRDAVNFIKQKYGAENILSYSLHMDEKTPHVHIDIVPIHEDKLNARALFQPGTLEKLQTEIWKNVGAKYGLQRGVPKDKGKRKKHLSVNAYKAKRDAEQQQAEIDAARRRIDAQLREIASMDLTDAELDQVADYAKMLIAQRLEKAAENETTKTAMQHTAGGHIEDEEMTTSAPTL